MPLTSQFARWLAALPAWSPQRAPWRRALARRALRRLAGGIAPARQALLDFGARSSDEFTALAEDLGRLDPQLGAMRTQAAGLEATLQDHDEDRALASAFELYKKSVDLAHASIGIALSQEEEMAQMEHNLLQHRGHFHRNNLMFRMLVMNLRTETARIDPENRAVFSAVAGEMEAMEKRLTGTLETAFGQLEEIVHDAANGRVELQTLQRQLHENARGSVALLRGELDDLKSRLEPCLGTSREIRRLLASATDRTIEVITSLQYQDIVRQQLEHVCQGLQDIAAHAAPGSARGQVDFAYLDQAVRLQQAHLGTSRTAIADAGHKLDHSGRALLGIGSELVDRLSAMEQEAENVFRGSRIGELFARETEKLVATASQSEATNDRIARLLVRIEEIVRVFSSELRVQEFDVQLVALNAQVSAARLPAARALNKLAEETSQLSRHSSELSRTMTAQLGETLARLNVMRTEADEVRSTIGREKADLANGSIVVADKLARLNARITRSSTEVARHFGEAYAAVRQRLESLQFPAAIAAAYAPAEAWCAAARGVSAEAARGTTPSADRDLLRHHGRYTMQQERDAHAAALGFAPVAEDPVAEVELFGEEPAPGQPVAPATVAAAATADTVVELFGDTPPPATPSSAAAATRATPPADDGVELF